MANTCPKFSSLSGSEPRRHVITDPKGGPTANLNRELEMDFRLLNRCRNKHPPGLQVLIES